MAASVREVDITKTSEPPQPHYLAIGLQPIADFGLSDIINRQVDRDYTKHIVGQRSNETAMHQSARITVEVA